MSNDEPEIRLADDFYERSSALRFIRDTAVERFVAPDALLASLLTRISASIPPAYQLPAFKGSPAPVSLCAAIVGNPAQGKTQANAVARELLTVTDTRYRFDLGGGSGQGMIEAYLRKPRKGDADHDDEAKVQEYLGCHFLIDEGSTLLAAASKKEDITLDTIRSLWSGEPVGQTNASAATSRHLGAKKAAFGLVVGFQPSIAAAFIALGKSMGTPHRFLFFYAGNPSQPDYPPPVQGRLEIPTLGPRDEPIEFKFDPSIAQEIRKTHAAVMRGEIELPEFQTHDTLKTMKVAACLAILEGKLNIDTDDWAWASYVVEVSGNVLQDIMKKNAEKIMAEDAEKDDKAAKKQVKTQEKSRDDSVRAGAATMARKLRREMKTMTFSELSQAASGDDKKRASAEDMVAHGIQEGWIDEVPTERGKKYKAGRNEPPEPVRKLGS